MNLGGLAIPAFVMMILAFLGVWSLLFGGPTRGLLKRK